MTMISGTFEKTNGQSVLFSHWYSENPPKDGRTIVAIGRVIYEASLNEFDEFSTAPDAAGGCVTCSDQFLARIYWAKTDSGYEGWLDARNQLAIAEILEDEVIIDFWIFPPNEIPAVDPTVSAGVPAAVPTAAQTPAAELPAAAGQAV